MARKTTDLVLSVLATIVGFGLSWPFWRTYAYWAESHAAWLIYFILGFILAIYVFYVFIGCLRTLFEHDRLAHEGLLPSSYTDDSDTEETP